VTTDAAAAEHAPVDRRARMTALIAAAVVFAAVGVVLALTTPWNPLPGAGAATEPDPARDFTAAELARSRAFDAAISPPAYAGLVWGLAAVLVLGLTPWGARFIGWATARVRRRWLRLIVAVLAVTTLLRILGMPFAIWRQAVRRDYGLTNQTWAAWLADQAKSLGLTWILWSVVVLLLYGLARRFPRYWWTGAAAGGFVLVIALSFGYPVIVEPVFNKFHSLPAGPLRTDLLAMAVRDRVPVDDVLVADASRRTTTLNAYVSGFGSTRRIVLYDTLLRSTPPERIKSIVAHELGHAKRGDVLYGTLVGALSVGGAVCLLFLIVTSPRLLRRAGLPPGGTPDPRSVALLLAGAAVLTQLGAPVQNLVSRKIESRADTHALDLSRDPATFTQMQRELAVRNVGDLEPNPVEYVLWFTHPSAPQRIAMARHWARLHGLPEPPPLRR
jgi:Zn-dependent protease with chaperone function